MNAKKTIFVLIFVIICIGIYEYFKIGKSLVRSTLKQEFITVSPFSQNAGIEDSLPKEVIDAKKLIIRNQIDKYGLVDIFEKDVYLFQRLVEFSYPARFGSSPYYIGLRAGDLNNKCLKIDIENDVTLYECQ